MFSFSKKQIVFLSSFVCPLEGDEMLSWSYETFHQIFGDDVYIWHSIQAYRYYREMREYLDNYVSFGGEAWLKLADESHKLCLRNLNRILRTQPTLVKEA